MRDYLEELLGLIEPEEEGQAARELGGGGFAAVPEKRSSRTEQEDAETSASADAEEMLLGAAADRARAEGEAARGMRTARASEDDPQAERKAVEGAPEAAAVKSGRETALAVQLTCSGAGEMPRPAQRAGTGRAPEVGSAPVKRPLAGAVAETARAARYRLAQALPSLEVQREPVFRMEEPGSLENLEARRLDRVFERDARRYDCGFTLF